MKQVRTPIGRRLGSLAFGAAALLAGTTCKRPMRTEVPGVWDDFVDQNESSAMDEFAPRWPAPTVTALEDGLLTVWLNEPETPALHVRIAFATDGISAEITAVILAMLRQDLRDRLEPLGITVNSDHGPGRIEFGVHGHVDQLRDVTEALTAVVSATDSGTKLVSARDQLAADLDMPVSVELAIATLIQALVPSPTALYVRGSTLEDLLRPALVSGWDRATDPRNAVLVIHAGISAKQGQDDLQRLGAAWKGRGRRKAGPSTFERLREPVVSTKTKDTFLSGLAAPALLTSSTEAMGGGVVAFGRMIRTATATERAMARLAQRVAQEQFDARLTISGDQSLFMVIVPLEEGHADRELVQAVAAFSAFIQQRQPRLRLQQATQLWLGARVVEASLNGEDWTHLWMEAFDLSTQEANIPTAIAQEAEAMLAIQPDALQEWQMQWLDPREGEPGWSWAIAGASARTLEQVSLVVKTAPAP